MPAVLPTLSFAHLSDVGRQRLTHEDACHCDPNMGLFVVCDGLGGRPSGEAASQIIAFGLSHLIRRRLRKLKTLDSGTMQTILREIAIEVSAHMRELAEQIDTLRGMGATLSALLVDGRNAYILHAGDSRVYLLRDGKLDCVTTDHFRLGARRATSVDQMTHPHMTTINQRLLTQFIGIGRPLEPEVIQLQLKPGDRLLLCTDGLTDPVSDEKIAAMLGSQTQTLGEICQALVTHANERGGPDNITAVIVEYERLRLVEKEELRAIATIGKSGKPIGASTKFHAALVELQKDLEWLSAGAKEAKLADKAADRMAAYATIKQRLGALEFNHYMEQHGGESPAHLFHRAVSKHDSLWRRQYESHQSELVPHLVAIVEHAIRLSPLLTGEETAAILSTLWRDWQRVEERYLAICRRESFDPADHALDVLLEQMRGTVSTMIGLMEFFPRFMRIIALPGVS